MKCDANEHGRWEVYDGEHYIGAANTDADAREYEPCCTETFVLVDSEGEGEWVTDDSDIDMDCSDAGELPPIPPRDS